MSEEQGTSKDTSGGELAGSDHIAEGEYEALRREIELQITERHKTENQVQVAIAAIYAWVFTQKQAIAPDLFSAALYIPVFLSFFGFVRWAGIQSRTMTIGEYLRKKEAANPLNKYGWETFLHTHRTKRLVRSQLEGWSEVLVWMFLIVGTIVAAVWLG